MKRLLFIIFIAVTVFGCVKKPAADIKFLVADMEPAGIKDPDSGFRQPVIKLASPDAVAANAEIEKLYKSQNERKSTMKSAGSMESTDTGTKITADYNAALRGTMLTVLITFTYEYGSDYNVVYYSYAFNTMTGRSMDYAAFLAEFGLDAARAEFYVKQAVTNLAWDWEDEDFAPYQTYRNAIIKNIESYRESVTSDYITFYIDKDDKPCITLLMVTPDGSREEPITLAESRTAPLLRGDWTLDAGDRVYTLTFTGEDGFTITVKDAEGNPLESHSGSFTAVTEGTEIILSYTVDAGSTASVRLTGTFLNEFITAPFGGTQLFPRGEYTYTEAINNY